MVGKKRTPQEKKEFIAQKLGVEFEKVNLKIEDQETLNAVFRDVADWDEGRIFHKACKWTSYISLLPIALVFAIPPSPASIIALLPVAGMLYCPNKQKHYEDRLKEGADWFEQKTGRPRPVNPHNL